MMKKENHHWHLASRGAGVKGGSSSGAGKAQRSRLCEQRGQHEGGQLERGWEGTEEPASFV